MVSYTAATNFRRLVGPAASASMARSWGWARGTQQQKAALVIWDLVTARSSRKDAEWTSCGVPADESQLDYMSYFRALACHKGMPHPSLRWTLVES